MSVTKLRIPNGCTAVSHNGLSLDISESGTIEVDEESTELFLSHGFTDAQDASRDGDESDRSPEVVKVHSVTTDAPGSDIDGLGRRALFSILRREGVSVSLPITNEELRSVVRRIIQK